jgi:hypothetical protein
MRFSFDLAFFALCDLPNDSVDKLLIFHPGLFLHGPDEKKGLTGFCWG